MKDLAPSIMRQRLLIEANYTKDVTKEDVVTFLKQLPQALNLKIYSDPIVYSPGGEGREENQGFDGFIPLIDSGIAIYVWTQAKFLSVVLYTCKAFDKDKAKMFTQSYFAINDMESLDF